MDVQNVTWYQKVLARIRKLGGPTSDICTIYKTPSTSEGVVLWYRDVDNSHVTHRWYLNDEGDAVLLQGHYDMPFAEASEDFVKRAWMPCSA